MKLTKEFKARYKDSCLYDRRDIRSAVFMLLETGVISEKQYSPFRDFFYQ